MAIEQLFRTLPSASAAKIDITFNGTSLSVLSGRSVAAALLAAGVQRFRTTPVSASPRAPYCMMGICFECLIEIDGVANRQACLVEVREGMQIRTQEGARDWNIRPSGVEHV
jgi:predicted molibdopterin-dependent oxidoreductase YjgC